jgi:hypothetical protein
VPPREDGGRSSAKETRREELEEKAAAREGSGEVSRKSFARERAAARALNSSTARSSRVPIDKCILGGGRGEVREGGRGEGGGGGEGPWAQGPICDLKKTVYPTFFIDMERLFIGCHEDLKTDLGGDTFSPNFCPREKKRGWNFQNRQYENPQVV